MKNPQPLDSQVSTLKLTLSCWECWDDIGFRVMGIMEEKMETRGIIGVIYIYITLGIEDLRTRAFGGTKQRKTRASWTREKPEKFKG